MTILKTAARETRVGEMSTSLRAVNQVEWP